MYPPVGFHAVSIYLLLLAFFILALVALFLRCCVAVEDHRFEIALGSLPERHSGFDHYWA
jgi:hypothetical protein